MPRPNDYPRWRYITMQAAMWAILLCAVGVAALASRFKRGASGVTLGEPQLLDSVTVRLPKGWDIANEGADAISAVEDSDEVDRRIVLVRERDPRQTTLLNWITGANPAVVKRGGRSSTIVMGPGEGALSITRKPIQGADRRVPYRELDLTATSTLPNGHVLTITVNCFDLNGSNEESAMEVLKLVAQSVQYVPANDLPAGAK